MEARRDALAQTEASLREQARLSGYTTETAEAIPKVGGAVIFSPPGKKNHGETIFEVMTPRPTTNAVQSPSRVVAGSGGEPMVFPMEDSPTAANAAAATLGPVQHRLSLSMPSPSRSEGGAPGSDMGSESGGPATGAAVNATPRQLDDWERGLETIGVAKCGVCGMKLPLEVGAIEQHSLECEAAKREGRKLKKADIVTLVSPSVAGPQSVAAGGAAMATPTGSASHQRPLGGPGSAAASPAGLRPAAATAAAAAAAVAANAGATVAALAARASGAGGGGGGYPLAGASPAPGSGASATAPRVGPPVAVGDRAALLRSRMQRSKSSQPSSRTTARWRGAGF